MAPPEVLLFGHRAVENRLDTAVRSCVDYRNLQMNSSVPVDRSVEPVARRDDLGCRSHSGDLGADIVDTRLHDVALEIVSAARRLQVALEGDSADRGAVPGGGLAGDHVDQSVVFACALEGDHAAPSVALGGDSADLEAGLEGDSADRDLEGLSREGRSADPCRHDVPVLRDGHRHGTADRCVVQRVDARVETPPVGVNRKTVNCSRFADFDVGHSSDHVRNQKLDGQRR